MSLPALLGKSWELKQGAGAGNTLGDYILLTNILNYVKLARIFLGK